MNIKPRPYQLEARNKILRALAKVGRALMVMATGLGKTIASAITVKKLDQFPGIFLVHDNTILVNAMGDFRKVFGDTLKFGIYNGLEKDIEGADIVFASFQTMQRNLHHFGRRQFKWMIVDEGHHSWAETFRKVIDFFWCKKIAMTATPDRTDMQDIRDIFGIEVFDLPLDEAIARGLLPPIEYHVITDKGFDDKELARMARRVLEKGERVSMKEVNARIFIKTRDKKMGRIIAKHGAKAAIFCRNIYHTEHLRRLLVDARTYHSGNSYNKNQAALHGFSTGEVRHLLAVNSFNEGHHLPDTDLIVFQRAHQSVPVFYQQLGRGLHPGQKRLTVLDFVGSLERILEVKELAERIERLGRRFRTLEKRKRGHYRKGRFHVSGKGFKFLFASKVVKILKVIERLNVEFYPTFQDASSAAQRLGIKTRSDYGEKYTLDPRLPSSPETLYPEFKENGWRYFLGFEKKLRKTKDEIISSFHEARKLARSLGAKTEAEYHELYLEHRGLTRSPRNHYDKWKGWPDFLGTGRALKDRSDLYRTIGEARKACQKLGINSSVDYLADYTEDPRLPAHPREKYGEKFVSWSHFLGRTELSCKEKSYYPSCKQARITAQKLRITTKEQYRVDYKKDPRLPSDPSVYYSETFPGWKKFLGTK